jgi:DNA-binding response OmpR family regulator
VTRLLVVEDDPLVSSFLVKGLRAKGYVVDLAEDGVIGTELALAGDFHLVILDMALPKREGFEVLQQLRGLGSRLPVLVLTGRPDLRDVIACFEVGADDYMIKPFRFDELLARVRARLRERGIAHPSSLQHGRVRLDLLTRRATVGGLEVELTGREFTLLEVFLRHPGHVLSREQLLSAGWGYSFDPGTNVVNVFVSGLRSKLGADVIETCRGVGYRFVG